MKLSDSIGYYEKNNWFGCSACPQARYARILIPCASDKVKVTKSFFLEKKYGCIIARSSLTYLVMSLFTRMQIFMSIEAKFLKLLAF